MKKIIKDIILLTVIVLYFLYIIKYSSYISKQVTISINLWIKKIIPSLFPTLILLDLIYSSKIPYIIEKYLHINIIYILSIISGSPSNAYAIKHITDNKEYLLSVSKYISLIFLYNSLNSIFNYKLTIVLILCNILSNLIIIIIFHPKNNHLTNIKNNINKLPNIKNHMDTLISILGTIILFNTLPIFLIKNKYISLLLSSILEITTFFNKLQITEVSLKYKLFVSIIAISTCGLCIEAQIKSIIADTPISYKKYYKYRLLHFIIYFTLVLITIKFIL